MGLLRVAVMVVITAVAVTVLPGFLSSPPPLNYQGTTAKGWQRVGEVFKNALVEQPNFGFAYSVYHEGKKVVDLYGGYADVSTLEPYRENTLTTLFSSTKGISALCVAVLVDRGLLDYKKKVVDYWPEFGVNGKESITVETLLSHQAGLTTISEGFSMFDILDNPAKISKQLAEQKPLWEPGSKQAYHALTISMYMNELVIRADPKHRPLHQFFKEELVEPLGLDVFIGLPFAENYRVARFGVTLDTWDDWYGLLFDDGWRHMLPNKFQEIMDDCRNPTDLFTRMGSPYIRQVPNGSFSGYGTARDLAKLMGILANGGTYNGKTYLSPKTTKLLTEVMTERLDDISLRVVPYGRGTTVLKSPKGNRMFGTPGMGGQMVFGDLEHKLGFAFLTNKVYTGNDFYTRQFTQLLEATYDILEKR